MGGHVHGPPAALRRRVRGVAVVLSLPLYGLWRIGLSDAGSMAAPQFLTLYVCGVVLVALPGVAGWTLGSWAIEQAALPDDGEDPPEADAVVPAPATAGRPRVLGMPWAAWQALWGRLSGPRVRKWAVKVGVGEKPWPRAWDYVFGRSQRWWIRAKVKDLGWIGGLYDSRSNAGRYPSDRQDLYLQEIFLVDAQGRFITGTGAPIPASDAKAAPPGEREDLALLIRWEAIEIMLVEPARPIVGATDVSVRKVRSMSEDDTRDMAREGS